MKRDRASHRPRSSRGHAEQLQFHLKRPGIRCHRGRAHRDHHPPGLLQRMAKGDVRYHGRETSFLKTADRHETRRKKNGNQENCSQPLKGPSDWFTGNVGSIRFFQATEPALFRRQRNLRGVRGCMQTHPIGQDSHRHGGLRLFQREGTCRADPARLMWSGSRRREATGMGLPDHAIRTLLFRKADERFRWMEQSARTISG